MKTRIKVIINGNEYLVESTYESGIEAIIKVIDNITSQELKIMEARNG